jgi:hypothetical protein
MRRFLSNHGHKLLFWALLTAGVAGFTACADEPVEGGDSVTTIEQGAEGRISAITVTLPDGAVTQCVIFDAYNGGGGITCDWTSEVFE